MKRVTKTRVVGQESKKKLSLSTPNSVALYLGITALVLFVFGIAGNYLQKVLSGEYQKEKLETLTRTFQSGQFDKRPPEGWEWYVNTDIDIALPVPRFLSKSEANNVGGYLLFVKLQKTDFSQGDGLAFGITNRSIEQERKNFIDSLPKEERGNVKETKSKVDDSELIRLDIDPKGEGLESKSILIFKKEDKTISLSSTPSHVDTILEYLTFVRV